MSVVRGAAPLRLVWRRGLSDYASTWAEMRAFTVGRTEDTPDEIWLLQHTPVFTLGQVGRSEHLLDPGNIAVIRTDRGGQVTYHGPGQLVAYVLVDLRRLGLGIKGLVRLLEASVIAFLAGYGIEAEARPEAPGVYVAGAKIASLGLRVRRGCTYHGLSLNVDMDLTPFLRIDPCGYPGLAVTQLVDLGGPRDLRFVGESLAGEIARRLAGQG